MISLDDDRALAAWEEWWLREPSEEDPEEDLFNHELLKGDEEWAERV